MTDYEKMEKMRIEAEKILKEKEGGHNKHVSFLIDEILEEVAEKYGFEHYGVEGDTEENGDGHRTIQYLNTGNTYKTTLCYYEGEFIVFSWGGIMEELKIEKQYSTE